MPRDDDEKDRLQYAAWGVLTKNNNVRSAHIANGIVQLLRLLPEPPDWRKDEAAVPSDYIANVRSALGTQFPDGWDLRTEARALSVTGSKHGPIELSREVSEEAAEGLDAASRRLWSAGHSHLQSLLVEPASFSTEAHQVVASVLNADGRVLVSQAADPSTPGFSLAGYSSPHTLTFMHAATFLGLLSATEVGSSALTQIYGLLSTATDPHSAIARSLQVDSAIPTREAPRDAIRSYPLPPGDEWRRWADLTSEMVSRLLDWQSAGVSKSETLMAVLDVATLCLFMRIIAWPQEYRVAQPRLTLCVSAPEQTARWRRIVERAQVSLAGGCHALDQAARDEDIVHSRGEDAEAKELLPSEHAKSIATSGGWLLPRDRRGGAKQYFSPGSRQLTTLVRALVRPSEPDLTWAEFTARAEQLGLVFGGLHEHSVSRRLGSACGAATLSDIGSQNKRHLAALGLARIESDDVIRIDGGRYVS